MVVILMIILNLVLIKHAENTFWSQSGRQTAVRNEHCVKHYVQTLQSSVSVFQ